jgi:hypothetical protein
MELTLFIVVWERAGYQFLFKKTVILSYNQTIGRLFFVVFFASACLATDARASRG